MNHLGDTNKMVDTPRTDAEYERLFEIYRNWERKNEPLCCSFENDMRLCRQLERELNAANVEIERLTAKVAQLYAGAEEQKQRIMRLEEALEGTVKWIVDLADSGDAGFWNPEEQPEIIAARDALKKEAKL